MCCCIRARADLFVIQRSFECKLHLESTAQRVMIASFTLIPHSVCNEENRFLYAQIFCSLYLL